MSLSEHDSFGAVPELYCQEVTCTAVILAALDTLPGFNVCDKAAHAL